MDFKVECCWCPLIQWGHSFNLKNSSLENGFSIPSQLLQQAVNCQGALFHLADIAAYRCTTLEKPIACPSPGRALASIVACCPSGVSMKDLQRSQKATVFSQTGGLQLTQFLSFGIKKNAQSHPFRYEPALLFKKNSFCLLLLVKTYQSWYKSSKDMLQLLLSGPHYFSREAK